MLGLGAITSDAAVNVLLKSADDTLGSMCCMLRKGTLKCSNTILGV